jgi:hypothetical protein
MGLQAPGGNVGAGRLPGRAGPDGTRVSLAARFVGTLRAGADALGTPPPTSPPPVMRLARSMRAWLSA